MAILKHFEKKNEVIELWWLQIWNESERKKLVYRPIAARSEPGNTKLILILFVHPNTLGSGINNSFAIFGES